MSRTLLAEVLVQPQRAAQLDLRGWECLIAQARVAELMGQLQRELAAAGLQAAAPAAAWRHLALAEQVAQRHARAVGHELHAIEQALAPLGGPVVLLKGAAYTAQGLRAGQGRLYTDIDLLVPRANLDAVEHALGAHGYVGLHTNAYDQRYYRVWMHEIPPLEHVRRGTVLDVHHTLLPPTSGIRPDVAGLLARARPAPAPWSFFQVLAPAEQVLHSACHLFLGEFHKGLRDLFDLHQLMVEHGRADPAFFDTLRQRAAEHGLMQPLADALHACDRVFGTPLPAGWAAQLPGLRASPWPPGLRRWLFDHGLRPWHPSAQSSRLARWLLFVRSHWLRMPLPLLAYHLGRKALGAED